MTINVSTVQQPHLLLSSTVTSSRETQTPLTNLYNTVILVKSRGGYRVHYCTVEYTTVPDRSSLTNSLSYTFRTVARKQQLKTNYNGNSTLNYDDEDEDDGEYSAELHLLHLMDIVLHSTATTPVTYQAPLTYTVQQSTVVRKQLDLVHQQ